MENKNYFEIKEDKCEEWSKILWELLQTSENYLYLIWAWCSVESKWKTISELWNIMSWKEDEEWNLIIDKLWTIKKIDNFDTLREDVWYKGEDLEELLTRIKITENYFSSFWDDKKAEKEKMEEFRKNIEKQLTDHCTKDIKLWNNSVHLELLSKVINWRKLSLPRTKIFTLNYDTLFEEAWKEWWYTIIDWFSFSMPRTFNGTNFDLDIVKRNKNFLEKENNFEKNVFHLYKLHGSVNWHEEGWKIKQRDNTDWKLIYPGSSKYEESYEMPYFEMISRFQQELRKENVVLTIIWYSFSDNHINSMIIEAFKTNPSLRLVIVWTSIFDNTDKNIKEEKIKILNQWLKIDRVFLFNMYFEPFVSLIPLKEIKTKEEMMLEALKQINNK